MAVDQTGGQCHPMRMNLYRRIIQIHILGIANIGNPAIDRDNAITIKDGRFQLARQNLADIGNHKFF